VRRKDEVRRYGSKEVTKGRSANPSQTTLWVNPSRTALRASRNGSAPPSPLFFVSVASKGVSPAVSLLFATLAGGSISVAARELTQANCWRGGNFVRPNDSEGVRRTTWRAGRVGGVKFKKHYSNIGTVCQSITCKWFGCCQIARILFLRRDRSPRPAGPESRTKDRHPVIRDRVTPLRKTPGWPDKRSRTDGSRG
jgi:hypothetical protein